MTHGHQSPERIRAAPRGEGAAALLAETPASVGR